MNLYRGFRQCSSLFKVILPFLLKQKQKNIQNFANITFYAIHHDKNILNSCKNLSAWILLSVPIPKKGFEVGLIISYSFLLIYPPYPCMIQRGDMPFIGIILKTMKSVQTSKISILSWRTAKTLLGLFSAENQT